MTKILLLHGWTQTGEKMWTHTGALRKKLLRSSIECSVIDAPFPADSEKGGLSWWTTANDKHVYKGWRDSINRIERHIDEHQCDGILGFSQGAGVVGAISALKERNEGFARLKFVIAVSGFICRADDIMEMYPVQHLSRLQKERHESIGLSVPLRRDHSLPDDSDEAKERDLLYLDALSNGHLTRSGEVSGLFSVPSLHVIGRRDNIVSPMRSLNLSDCFNFPTFFTHTGGHFVPPRCASAIENFVEKVMK